MRANTSIRLSMDSHAPDAEDADDGADEVARGTSVVVNGSLVRFVKPDEQSIARRLQSALDAAGQWSGSGSGGAPEKLGTERLRGQGREALAQQMQMLRLVSPMHKLTTT